MNLKILFTTFLGLAILILAGCSPKYYIPNTQNTPVIHEKNDAELTVAGNGNQYEFQGAYGLSNQVAVQLNAGFMAPEEDEDGDRGSGKFIEGGIGYYTDIAPSLQFSTYGLLGFGSVENDFPSTVNDNPSTSGEITANLTRVGVQPGLSYYTKNFSITGSARFVNLSYSNIEGSLIFADEDQVNYLEENDSNFLLEPALTIRGGSEKVKLQLQLTRSFNLSNSDFRQDDALFTLGLNFGF